MDKPSRYILTLVVLILVGCLCVSALCLAAAGLVVYRQIQSGSASVPDPHNNQPSVVLPTLGATPAPLLKSPQPTFSTTPTPFAESHSSPETAAETLRTLRQAIIPINDPVDLAARLKGRAGLSPTLPPPAHPLQVGNEQTFWVTNGDTDEKRQVTATLRYINDRLYFWVENGVTYRNSEMRRLADTFAAIIYPTNREFFGSEWNPGVDGDPRLHVLYVRNVGSSVAGYFSSADEFPPTALEFSNAREMFVLNADNVSLGEPYIYGTMAHEFQHMIHFHTDRNEESWLNEGFSVLAELLNGYNVGGFDYLFMIDPDLSLTYWPGPGQSGPNYGASFLFVTYFLSRYGEDATKALVANPENGLESIDRVFAQRDETNPATGLPVTADDFFADWAVANYLDDPSIAQGKYHYARYPQAPKASPTEEFSNCPVESQTRSVNQYGTDYIRITCPGAHRFVFQGNTLVPLLPVDPYSGNYAFWSNKGDESDMTLTRSFDFTNVSAPIQLSYRTWYDLESGYDYVYLLASEDGKTWHQIHTPSGTDENPNGNNYGWGYNGESGPAWRLETVDLSAFAGKKIQLRFEYITDTAVYKEGFLIDDLAVDAVGYSTDFENDDGGWLADGFVRVSNRLPQTFRVSLILLGSETRVVPLELDATQHGSVDFTLGGEHTEAVLVISGTTRFTTRQAQYRFEIQ